MMPRADSMIRITVERSVRWKNSLARWWGVGTAVGTAVATRPPTFAQDGDVAELLSDCELTIVRKR
jgi:hypothetical protein